MSGSGPFAPAKLPWNPSGGRGILPPVADETVIAGVHPVIEALAGDTGVRVVYLAVGLRGRTRKQVEAAARRRGVRLMRADRRELDRLAGGVVHQGVVALGGGRDYSSLADLVEPIPGSARHLLLVLDGVQDPRNLGAIARSALALGAAGLVLPGRRAVGITPAALKASAGALSRLPVARVSNLSRSLQQLKDEGFWVSGAVAEGGQGPWEIDPGERVALVLGSEGGGVRPGVERLLDFRVTVPLAGPVESLNVSVAAALLLYEWLGRRQKAPAA